MKRNMAKTIHANVPNIYPSKGVHKKSEHVQDTELVAQQVEIPVNQTPEIPKIDNEQLPIQEVDIDNTDVPIAEPQPLMVTTINLSIYTPRQIPNPLTEPSSFPKVMAKQVPKYEGILRPQPIEIELRGKLPSYDVAKAIEKYPFSMDIPAIEEINQQKKKLFQKIPENAILGDIPRQLKLDKFIDALKEKVIHDYNIYSNFT